MSPTGLLAEKAGLAAVCSLVVAMLMLAGLGLFVDLDWGRAPLWVLAAAVRRAGLRGAGPGHRRARARGEGGLAARLHARAAARVPGAGAQSGAVAPLLYDVIRGISALFPFKPGLDAMDVALNGSGSLAGR